MRKKKTRLFHATRIGNVPSILAEGLISKWEGVYLTDSLESALRWMGWRFQAMGEEFMAIIEVEVDETKLIEGTDHSPMMVTLFGVGKSLVSPKRIPPSAIKEVHKYELNPAVK
jgi:hypothetical protein